MEAIAAHLAGIPEDLAGIEPELLLGQYLDDERSTFVSGVSFIT